MDGTLIKESNMSCTDLPRYDFAVKQGDDETVKFRYIAAGAPVNLLGAVIRFECSLESLQQEATILNYGVYDSNINYVVGDKVLHNSINYICLEGVVLGESPTTAPAKWEVTEPLGEFEIAFSREDTADLLERRVKYEMVFWVNGLLGTKRTLFTGSINLTKEDAKWL